VCRPRAHGFQIAHDLLGLLGAPPATRALLFGSDAQLTRDEQKVAARTAWL